MIRYKVVRVNRRSCFSAGEYSLKYKKDAIVKADPKTLGVMVFKRKMDAIEFGVTRLTCTEFKILRVEPIGKGATPNKISVGGSINITSIADFDSFYSNNPQYRMKPPKGTICYPSVKVLN